MILLDADILLLDIRYPRDARFSTNEKLLKTLQEQGLESGVTLYALVEIIGILSFNLPTEQIQKLYALLPGRYGLQVIPALDVNQNTPTFLLAKTLVQLEKKWLWEMHTRLCTSTVMPLKQAVFFPGMPAISKHCHSSGLAQPKNTCWLPKNSVG